MSSTIAKKIAQSFATNAALTSLENDSGGGGMSYKTKLLIGIVVSFLFSLIVGLVMHFTSIKKEEKKT